MAFTALEGLAAAGGEGTQRDALIELDALSDDGGFADDDAGAVVDEEIIADGGAGVDVDAGEVVGVFGHDARDQRHLGFVEFVGDAVHADGEEAGIGEDDFIGVGGGGVAVKGGLDVGGEGGAQIGESCRGIPGRSLRRWCRSWGIRRRGVWPGGGWRCAPARKVFRGSTEISSPTWYSSMPEVRFCLPK